MKNLSKLAYLFGVLPFVTYAQCGVECDPITNAVLFGGDNYARDCYLNSQIVSQNTELAMYGMLKPCDIALEFVQMNKSNRAATHTNRGVVRTALGYYEGAFYDFNVGMTLLPEAAQIFVNRGNAFYYSENYQMAIEDYSRSLELGFADFADVYLNLGKSYERIGNIDLAERNYRQAAELSPNQAKTQDLLQGLMSQEDL